MPIVKAPRAHLCDQIVGLSQLIAADLPKGEPCVDSGQLDDCSDGPEIDQSDLWMVKYDELAQKTKNIPLSHLGCCQEGGELFNDLCMWVDINQKYVELGLFPQWYDIARELNIDQMKTEWVKVCVRPEQSFTRAILEIYMYDGGTLGEVIHALRRQKQYRIIQEISEKAEEFLDVYTVYHKSSFTNNSVQQDSHLYSIMRTLFETFSKAGYEDPLSKYQQYSLGFKHYLRNNNNSSSSFGLLGPGGLAPEDADIVLNAVQVPDPTAAKMERHDSGYTSPYAYSGFLPAMPATSTQVPQSIADLRGPRKGRLVVHAAANSHQTYLTVRILLVFATDGVDIAADIVHNMADFVYEENPLIKVDIFRLNEIDIWNAILLNPEACLLKWLDEMDFVMPILTPRFLQELHNNSSGPEGPPAPTSPLINKYIYTLIRSQFVSNGCKNIKVRPILPQEFESQLGRSKPVTCEPLFKMWKYADRESIRSRILAMVKIWARNNGHSD